MKTLIVVDVQYDFANPMGSLYVKGAENVIPEITKLIEEDKEIQQVIFTADWHTPEHCSFKDNGGTWPPHCLQHTQGASISEPLILACIEREFQTVDGKYDLLQPKEIDTEFLKDTFDIFQKGDSAGKEEYGAFEIAGKGNPGVITLSSTSDHSYSYIQQDTDIILCGVAGDYCVLETLKNLMSIPELTGNKYVFLPGIASIDGGASLSEYCKTNNIKEYEKSK